MWRRNKNYINSLQAHAACHSTQHTERSALLNIQVAELLHDALDVVLLQVLGAKFARDAVKRVLDEGAVRGGVPRQVVRVIRGEV